MGSFFENGFEFEKERSDGCWAAWVGTERSLIFLVVGKVWRVAKWEEKHLEKH